MPNYLESILDESIKAHRNANPNPATSTGDAQVRQSQSIVSAGKMIAFGLLAVAEAISSCRADNSELDGE